MTSKASHQQSLRVSRKATGAMLAALAGLGAATGLHAASQTWTGSASTSAFTTAGNWSGSAVPGATYVSGNTVNADVITFNSSLASGTIGGSADPIQVDLNRLIGGISFSGASVGSYVIGATNGNELKVSHNNQIQVASDVAAAQVINAPIAIRLPSSTNGLFTIANNATDSNATLTFGGTIIANPNSTTRPISLTLNGANTGNNAINGNLTTGGTQATINKSGAGTWILSGVNDFGANGSATNAGAVNVNGGVLSARNNAALSTNSVANAIPVAINSTGTLELANGITLDNGVSLNLNTGGTIRSSGNNTTNARINITTAAASTATISTVGAGDIFTIGNGANDLTGGASDTVLNIEGPGTVAPIQSSNYAGSWSLNSGTLRLGNASALGSSGAIAFGSGSTGKLQLNGVNVTASALNTNATVGTPVIENGGSSNSTLTVSSSANNTFAGAIQDGSTGALALIKSGIGSLSLTGANTYTGNTTVSGGVLKANNNLGSATGTGAVTVANGGTLGGSGTISGAVTVQTGGVVAPGNSVGTLTLGSLTASAGSIFNYEFNSTPANDQIVVSNTDGLTLNGGGFNLYSEGTANTWTTTGSYNLIQYTGAIQGTGVGSLSVLNPQAGYGYTFGNSGGFVTMDVSIAALISHWNVDASGSWATAGNWGNGIPNGSGEGAILDKALSSPATVTLDGSKTVGGLTLDSANGYTIASGSGGTLSLDSGASQASVIVTSGSHSITAPVALASNTVASVASGSALSISGSISGSGSLVKSGAGSLDLDSTNNYSGGTSVTDGTLNVVAGGLGSGGISLNGATLAYKGVNTDDLSAVALTLGASGGTLNIGSNNVTFANGIGNGGSGSLTKSGSGALTLAGNNTYTGSTVVSQGSLVLSGNNASTGGTSLTGANTSLTINSDSALGAVPGVTATNLTFAPGAGNTATLTATAAMTTNSNRTVALSSGTAVVDTNGNNVTLGGALTGSGNLAKSGAGTLTLGSVAVAATGTLAVNGGTLAAPTTAHLPTGSISLNNGALSLTANTAQSVSNLTVNGNSSISAANTGVIFGVGSLTGGSGNLTINGGGFVTDLTGSWSGFTGSITLGGSGGYRLNGATGSSSVAFDLGARGISVRSSATSIAFGSLSGSTGSTITGSGGGVTQAVTYTVGALGSNTTFAGVISDGANTTSLTKVGSGVLTLSGVNTFTGATTISAGSVRVTGKLGATAITVGASGTLAGFGDGLNTGVIGGATTVDGTLRANDGPLNASDRLTFSSTLNLASTANTTFDISGANYTGVTLSTVNSLTYGGSLNVNFSGAPLEGTYDLFNFTDSNPGAFTAVAVTSVGSLTSSSGVWSGTFGGTSYTFTEATGDLVVSAIPEPSSFAAFAGLAGVAAVGLRRRRRA